MKKVHPIHVYVVLALVFFTAALTIAGYYENTIIEKPALAASAREDDVFNKINKQRSDRGIARLDFSTRLYDCAKNWSQRMYQNDRLSHNNNLPNCAGTDYATENVAKTPGTSADVVAAWMGSCGHRSNILDPNTEKHGVARHYANGYEWWTSDFARYSAGVEVLKVLLDCSFEGDLTGGVRYAEVDSVEETNKWFKYSSSSNSSIIRVTNDPKHDQYSARFIDANSRDELSLAQIVKVTGGKKYSAQAWYKKGSNSAGKPALSIRFLDRDFKLIRPVNIKEADVSRSGWQQLPALTATAPNNAVYAKIVIRSSAFDVGTSFWDNVFFERIQ